MGLLLQYTDGGAIWTNSPSVGIRNSFGGVTSFVFALMKTKSQRRDCIQEALLRLPRKGRRLSIHSDRLGAHHLSGNFSCFSADAALEVEGGFHGRAVFLESPRHSARIYHSPTANTFQIGECELTASALSIRHWSRGGTRHVISRAVNKNVMNWAGRPRPNYPESRRILRAARLFLLEHHVGVIPLYILGGIASYQMD